ncbi:hypothetical protein E2C01_026434 [Portunus trituberculatus]|uniref:Uncharacterized protein n=1 Tax=Portunus trituberculatus TaxID=210409 RepID=A0A5B7EFX3_PORTR|nr:hypothetical protein [Portunus trituberculatus]
MKTCARNRDTGSRLNKYTSRSISLAHDGYYIECLSVEEGKAAHDAGSAAPSLVITTDQG